MLVTDVTDPEFLASPEIGSDLGAMDDILARKTGNIFTRTSDIFSLNARGLHSRFGQRPGQKLARRPAAQHEQIVFFQL